MSTLTTENKATRTATLFRFLLERTDSAVRGYFATDEDVAGGDASYFWEFNDGTDVVLFVAIQQFDEARHATVVIEHRTSGESEQVEGTPSVVIEGVDPEFAARMTLLAVAAFRRVII